MTTEASENEVKMSEFMCEGSLITWRQLNDEQRKDVKYLENLWKAYKHCGEDKSVKGKEITKQLTNLVLKIQQEGGEEGKLKFPRVNRKGYPMDHSDNVKVLLDEYEIDVRYNITSKEREVTIRGVDAGHSSSRNNIIQRNRNVSMILRHQVVLFSV